MSPLAAMAIGKAALKLAPLVLGRGGKRKHRGYGQVYGELKNFRPEGYVTADDIASAGRTRGELIAGVGEQARGQRMAAHRRFQARGIAGSPAEEATLSRLADTEARGVEGAGLAAQNQLYSTKMNREGFERDKGLLYFRSRLGELAQNDQRRSLESASFLSGVTSYLPNILKYLDGLGGSKSPYDSPIGNDPGAEWYG